MLPFDKEQVKELRKRYEDAIAEFDKNPTAESIMKASDRLRDWYTALGFDENDK